MLNVYTFTPKDYFGANTYLIELNGEYAVIDPSVEYDDVFKSHSDLQGNLKYILITHAHFDHIIKIKSWAEHCNNVKVGLNDAAALSDSYLNGYLGFLGIRDGYFGQYSVVKDGEILPFGQSSDGIRIIDTPGHTAGGVCYRIDDSIFVGDTVFAGGGYGRCDLPGGDIDVLEKSIIKLVTYEKDATLYPGHGGRTTLREFINFYM